MASTLQLEKPRGREGCGSESSLSYAVQPLDFCLLLSPHILMRFFEKAKNSRNMNSNTVFIVTVLLYMQ